MTDRADAEVRFTHLRPADFRRRRDADDRPVAWLPLGTMEWHGVHLPLGVDGIKAEALCVRGAQELGGVVFPTMYYGDHRRMVVEALLTPDSPFAPDDGINHRARVNELLGTDEDELDAQGDRDADRGAVAAHTELIVQSFWTIRGYGFARIVAIAGHYPNAGPLAAAADAFHRAQDECLVVHGTELELGGGDSRVVRHADSYETSQMLALDGSLVDMGALPPGEIAIGVVGDDPRAATREAGHAAVRNVIDGVRKRLSDFYDK